METKWISVEDRLPAVGEEVFFCNIDMEIPMTMGGPYHGHNKFLSWLSRDYLTATHWMPLPEPPTKQDK